MPVSNMNIGIYVPSLGSKHKPNMDGLIKSLSVQRTYLLQHFEPKAIIVP